MTSAYTYRVSIKLHRRKYYNTETKRECVTSLPMAGSPLRPLQGGSRRTTLLREPRKPVSWTRTEERQVEGGGSSHEPRAESARREVVSAAPPQPEHGGVTISGTSGGPRISMPLPHQRSHRNPPCSDASRCSHSSTERSKADAFSRSAIAVFCIDARFTPFHTFDSSSLSISVQLFFCR